MNDCIQKEMDLAGLRGAAEADIAAGVAKKTGRECRCHQAHVTGKADKIVERICSTLSSVSQILNTEVQKDLPGRYPLLILAELQNGPLASHDVMHLIRRAFAEVTSHLQSTSVLSSRLQREETGYSLRVSVACLPESQEDNVCWDMFRKGHCRRRSLCRWYHPQEQDIIKMKVTMKCIEEAKKM